MYTEEMIKEFNEYGVLSSSYLARKFKMNVEHACLVLSAILNDYTNVIHISKNKICIQGREHSFSNPKQKKIATKKKKESKWKDVTRP